MTGPSGNETVARAFELLSVPPDATRQELRLAFAAKCRMFHPDRHATGEATVRAAASERMRAVNEAYAVARQALRNREDTLSRGAIERRAPVAIAQSAAVVPTTVNMNRWERANRPSPLLGWVFDAVA